MILNAPSQTLQQNHMNVSLQADILSKASDHFVSIYSILVYCVKSIEIIFIDHLIIHHKQNILLLASWQLLIS